MAMTVGRGATLKSSLQQRGDHTTARSLEVTVSAQPLLGDEYQDSSLLVEIECCDTAQVQRIAVAGELDALSAPALHNAVDDVLCQHFPRRVEINLHGLSFLDSAGIRALLFCHARAQQRDCQLMLTDPHPMTYRILQITGLLDHFGLTERRDPNEL
jgi:anti-anti-sigma factor